MQLQPQQATAPDGRTVGFQVHGDLAGSPVFYLHGVPSSRLEVDVFDLAESARQAGVKLVAIDRAGIGGTDPKPGRTLLDTADDVAAVADLLEHETFALLGYSAGSPSALATASRLSSRITTLGVVSGIAPAIHPELMAGQADEVARMFRWAATNPRRLRAMLHIMKFAVHFPGLLAKAAAKGAPAVDRAVLESVGATERFGAMLGAAFGQGIDAVAAEFSLAAGVWPFPLPSLTLPTLIWHGALDRNAPILAARWLADQLPDSVLYEEPQDGHASLIANNGAPILAELKGSK